LSQGLTYASNRIIQTESEPDEGMTCPLCKKGTMMTILTLDVYGNIIIDCLPDETKPLETVMADSTYQDSINMDLQI